MAGKEYEVEGVSGRRTNHGTTEYLLKWKGYAKKTWTPISSCGSCKQLIDDFDRRNPRAQATPRPVPTSVHRTRSSGRLQVETGDEKDATSTPTSGGSRSLRRVTTGEKASTKNSGKRGRASKGKDGDDSESEGESNSTKTSTAAKKTKVDVSNGGLAVPSVQSQSDNPAVKLEEALTALLIAEPYIPFVRRDNQGDAIVIRMPPKILKSEDLPGIEVSDEQSYKDKGYSITAPTGEVEIFGDREVMNIVGYVPDDTRPFVLVKLDWKANEKELRIKDAVQAVHCPLAESLFPKAYKAYMDRVARRSQPPSGTGDGAGPSGTTAGPSGSIAGPSGSTAGTAGTSDGAGPSSAATPGTTGMSGRRTRRSID